MKLVISSASSWKRATEMAKDRYLKRLCLQIYNASVPYLKIKLENTCYIDIYLFIHMYGYLCTYVHAMDVSIFYVTILLINALFYINFFHTGNITKKTAIS